MEADFNQLVNVDSLAANVRAISKGLLSAQG
jgi:hypothetical protein